MRRRRRRVPVTHEAWHAAWADRVVLLREGVVVDESVSNEPETLLERHPVTGLDEKRCERGRVAQATSMPATTPKLAPLD